MKRIIYFMAFGLTTVIASAQDTYESVELGSSDLNGTARYVGMGGALSALGGDITTMGSNPAGTALFRHNEIAVTLGGVFTEEKGQLGHDASRMSFDQAGIVFIMDQSDASGSGLQYINFGINYMKKRNHLGNFNVANVGGLGGGDFSQTWQIANMANAAYGEFDIKGRDGGYWPVLADWFAPTYDSSKSSFNNDGALSYDVPADAFYGYTANSAAYQRATYGSNAQFDFNLSFNVSNQFFWGLSLGVYSMNYRLESLYFENNSQGNYYLYNWYDSKADGFDIKLGFICRPIEESPFRLGVYIHTPTWYSMDDAKGCSVDYADNIGSFNYSLANPDIPPYRYSYRTPWKFGLSIGHTIGKELAFGAEYEFTDPSTARYYNDQWKTDPDLSYINEERIKKYLRPQHTLKLGVEYKLVPEFALRLGYNFVSSPYKSNAHRLLDEYDTYATETAYINWKDLHRVTFGFGYRFKGGYFDVAYQYQAQKGDFYAFGCYNDYYDGSFKNDVPPTSVKNNRSQLMATLGFSF